MLLLAKCWSAGDDEPFFLFRRQALRQSIRRHSARRDRDSDTRSMALSIVNMTKVLIKEQIMDGAISKNESEHITQVC